MLLCQAHSVSWAALRRSKNAVPFPITKIINVCVRILRSGATTAVSLSQKCLPYSRGLHLHTARLLLQQCIVPFQNALHFAIYRLFQLQRKCLEVICFQPLPEAVKAMNEIFY